MTSITQLLSPAPWPLAKSHTIVLRDHPEHLPPPPPPVYQNSNDIMPPANPSFPPDPAHSPTNLGGGGGSEQSGEENGGDGRKGYGKRELSTSKRAAQNRAAQRAFRQRKEGYIKKLEEQVRDYQVLSENYKAVQAENYQLRDYIINLQSRLLESQGEVPPPPSNVDGLQPGKPNLPAQTPTLPRLAEMGSAGQSQDSPMHDSRPPAHDYFDQGSKRMKSDMTPAQAALQGASVLSQHSTTASR